MKFTQENNWFEKKYKVKSDSRYPTFKKALDLFLERDGKIIVECGTTRLPEDWGAGMSTVMFADFLFREVEEGYLSTVDISEDNINTCKEITKEWQNIIEYAVQDSIKFLEEFPFKVDLLYLDSLDYPYGEMLNDYGGREDINKAIEALSRVPDDVIEKKYSSLVRPAQTHQLKEYLAIQHKLSDIALVLLDDNNFPGGGKCKLTKKQLLEDGWKLVLEGQQSLWTR